MIALRHKKETDITNLDSYWLILLYNSYGRHIPPVIIKWLFSLTDKNLLSINLVNHNIDRPMVPKVLRVRCRNGLRRQN